VVVEWPGDHRIPLKSDDVKPVVQAILKLAKVCWRCLVDGYY